MGSGLRVLIQILIAIEEYIEFYNHNRFQKKLNNRPQVEYWETVVA